MKSKKGRLLRLESIRGVAATLVLVNHSKILSDTPLAPVGRMGQEAVMLFFLLSGFVIHYSAFGKCGADRDFSKALPFSRYLNHRFRRIYPLMLVGLAAAYGATSFVERHWSPMYWRTLGGNLIMLQDNGFFKRGVWFETYCGNTALWSLSYEWWFYMLFFPLFVGLWTWPHAQKYLAAGISIAGFLTYQIFPNQISLILGYFFIWWSGVELSREYCTSKRITWVTQSPCLILLVLLTVLWSVPVIIRKYHHAALLFGTDPVLQFRHFASAVAFLFLGILWYAWKFRGFDLLFKWFSLVAPISYSLYILHVPGLQVGEALMPTAPYLLQLVVLLVFLVPICYLLEVVVQRRINRWFDLLDHSRSAIA
jgi:peptidoglycan/LPS O-acetylase OafA/YrhL